MTALSEILARCEAATPRASGWSEECIKDIPRLCEALQFMIDKVDTEYHKEIVDEVECILRGEQ